MTKYIICLGDGMSDEPMASLSDKTALEYAKIPTIDTFAKNGQTGLVHTVPEGCHPGSDVANMGILGYDPREFYTGRGPIEAASMGIETTASQVIFRCNLVTIENNSMKEFTAGHITDDESKALMQELNNHFTDPDVKFFSGVGYRNIVLLNKKYNDLKTTAPHDILDKDIQAHLPKGELESELLSFIEEAHTVLKNSPVNKKRKEKNLPQANYIWPWSQGLMPKFPSFKSKYNKTGGIITAVDLLKGLACLSGLEAPLVKGATGFIDTNYPSKIEASLEVLKNHDFVYIHIEAPDECGHMGDEKLKVKAIEDFDKKVVSPVANYIKENPDTVLLILPDHPTPCSIKTHTSDPVPFVLYNPKISPDSTQVYSEKEAKKGALNFQYPWELLDHFLSLSGKE
jgi:2,3-bisphosphoglycerate-independent phosphoglycerate mutase